MAFTTPILFTPKDEVQRREFIEHLGKVGYTPLIERGRSTKHIYTFDDGIYVIVEANLFEHAINCGSNLELAKALSALRDDSDYMQWFIGPLR